VDFHRDMSCFMLSPPQLCTNIKTKSARGICFMLKIFRLILGKNNRNVVFAYQIKKETLGRVQNGWFGNGEGPIYDSEFGSEKRPIMPIYDFVYVSLLAFQYFLSYIMAVSFIWKTTEHRRKSMTIFIILFLLSTHKLGIVLFYFLIFLLNYYLANFSISL